MSCDPNQVLAKAACYLCHGFDGAIADAAELAILCAIRDGRTDMPCDVESLMKQANCLLSCIPAGAFPASKIAVLCQVLGGGGLGGGEQYALFQHREVSGTNGGDFLSGAWRTVALNTEVTDLDNVATIDANSVITLVAGTYRVRGWMEGFGAVGPFTCRLVDVATGTTLLIGQSSNCGAGPGLIATTSNIEGLIVVSAGTQVRFEGQCAGSQVITGFGKSTGLTNPQELYASLEFFKR
jgi:hypothetical protein